MSTEPLIQIRNMNKFFGNFQALKNINLEVNRGERIVVCGPSGSGKSTMIRCINRLEEHTDGHIIIDGKELTDQVKDINAVRREVGMVFQSFGLLPHLSVAENISFPLSLQGLSAKEQREKTARVIELVGLEGREKSFPRQLSGGQQQRVGIARSLAVEPELWFLDEPFSALDPLIRRQMQDEFLRIQSTLKKSIVFITHDFLEALRIADRMMIMRDGMVVQIGTPAELIINPADDYVAEFTSDVPLTRVLLARDVIDDTATVQAGMFEMQETVCVEDLLCHLAIHRDGVAVVQNGNPIGVVTPTSVVCAFSKGEEGKADATRQQETG